MAATQDLCKCRAGNSSNITYTWPVLILSYLKGSLKTSLESHVLWGAILLPASIALDEWHLNVLLNLVHQPVLG